MQFQHPSRRAILSKWFPRTSHLSEEPSRGNAGEETASREGAPIGGATGEAAGGKVERDREGEGGCARADHHDGTRTDTISDACATKAGAEIISKAATRIAHEEINRTVLSAPLSRVEGSVAFRISEGLFETKEKG